MELTPTAKVILGMLSFGPKTGYEIKALVDRSTRFFWAASYGQIYPELRKLGEAGLIDGTDAAQGERRRIVYRLTADGESALRDWLGTSPEVMEMRHEGMLKVFFADALDPGERVQRIRDMGDQHRRKAAVLHEVEAGASKSPDSSAYQVLRFGIEFNEWVAEWCDRTASELDERLGAGVSS
jgi:PadR family transcriptional regulator, regulatory protein AphA